MFPKKVIAVLCAAVLVVAMPTSAFANGIGEGGWFVDANYSGTDVNGQTYEIHAGYYDEDMLDEAGYAGKWVPLNVSATSTSPSNWPTSAENFLGTFFDISSDTYTQGKLVSIRFLFPESYDSSNRNEKISLTFYVEHDDGTTQTFNSFVGDSQYCITGFDMNKLSRIGVAETSAISAGTDVFPETSEDSVSSDSGIASEIASNPSVDSSVSPQTGIDTDGVLFGAIAYGALAILLCIIVVRRVQRQH